MSEQRNKDGIPDCTHMDQSGCRVSCPKTLAGEGVTRASARSNEGEPQASSFLQSSREDWLQDKQGVREQKWVVALVLLVLVPLGCPKRRQNPCRGRNHSGDAGHAPKKLLPGSPFPSKHICGRPNPCASCRDRVWK